MGYNPDGPKTRGVKEDVKTFLDTFFGRKKLRRKGPMP